MNELSSREFLRHALATLAYRAEKPLRDAPSGFSATRVAKDTRSAGEILAHMGDLIEWAITAVEGQPTWKSRPPTEWAKDVARFYDLMRVLDDYLVSDAPLSTPATTLFQGPIADALTHVGQLATLRRVAGSPVRGESYIRAEVVIGRVGPEQSQKRTEFD